MGEDEMMAIVEAILFVSDEAVSLADISSLLGIEHKACAKLMDKMIERFGGAGRGLKILKANDSFRLATCPSCKEYIERFTGLPREKGLSRSSFETLSIIAYHQPVTRLQIEKLKGTSCAYSLDILLKKGLIIEKGRIEAIGRPIQYGTTDQFLRCFGFSSLKDLPAFDK